MKMHKKIKYYVYLFLLSSLVSSTYEVITVLDDYSELFQGAKVFSNQEKIGKVRLIQQNNDGKWLITLIIYSKYDDISNDMLFKVESSSLVVDYEAMKLREQKKEEKRLAKIKAEEEARASEEVERLAKIKVEEEARASEEAERLVKIKVEEQIIFNKTLIKEIKRIDSNLYYLTNILSDKDSIITEELSNLNDHFFSYRNKSKINISSLEKMNNLLLIRIDELERVINLEKNAVPIEADDDESEIDTIDFMDSDFAGFSDFGAPTPIQNSKRAKWVKYDSPPTPKKKLDPKYPAICKQAGIEGRVTIGFWVDENGIVDLSSVEVLESIPCLDQVCLNLIKQSKWHPARQGRKRVGVPMTKSFKFTLK